MNGLNVKTVNSEINKESEQYLICIQNVVNYETGGKYTTKKRKKDEKEQVNEHTGIVRRIISGNNAAA